MPCQLISSTLNEHQAKSLEALITASLLMIGYLNADDLRSKTPVSLYDRGGEQAVEKKEGKRAREPLREPTVAIL